MSASKSIAVLGAGSWGTALAMVLAKQDHPTTLWTWQEQHARAMNVSRKNSAYLPDIELPENLVVTHDLQSTVESCDTLLIVVPSHAFSELVSTLSPWLTPSHRIMFATKGLDKESSELLSVILKEKLGQDRLVAMLSGPSFAKEVAQGLPTSVIIASESEPFAQECQQLFHCKTFRTYIGDDIIGLQLCGAVKNVLAIATGIADGYGFGANTEAAIITRGMAQMRRLGLAMGAKADTFMGLAGLGDLLLTCTNNQSRNRRFGLYLGQEMTVNDAIEKVEQVVEGYDNARQVRQLAHTHQIEFPLVEAVYDVCFEGKKPQDAISELLSRPVAAEYP